MTTDFKKVHKELYTASATPVVVDVPELTYLMVDGVGEPGTETYGRAVEAIYGVAYAIRFALKPSIVYSVMPLQGRWWAEEGDISLADRSAWHWSMMIMQPPQASAEVFDAAAAKVRKKKPAAPVDAVRLEPLTEGRSVQVMHVGPYAEETPTVGRLLGFAREQGYVPTGHHHEIYISDPSRTDASKLKTIIRYPVATAA